MMRKVLVTVFLFLLFPLAVQSAEPPEVKLQNWYFGIDIITGRSNQYNVFGRDEWPSGEVLEPASGCTLKLGRRFGGRFLLGLELGAMKFTVDHQENSYVDGEVSITGTMLFRSSSFFQPYLKGGIGFGADALDLSPNNTTVISYGPATLAGAGLMLRLGSRVSFDVELVSTFTNFLEVANTDEATHQVRTSNFGWRLGSGISLWF
ncbi:MAG: hypothetical protein GY780_15280 [bacterium]|nr:hypothetical protein [bacterium]